MTAKAKNHLMDCPVCNEKGGAQVGQSAKGYAYAVCDSCGMQLFTRSRFAHERLMLQCSEKAPDPPPDPKPKPDPDPAPKPAPKPDDGGSDDWLI